MSSDSNRFLHVANGGSTTATLEAAGVPGSLSLWADPLNEGPVPGGIGDAELLKIRAEFLSGPEHPEVEVADDLARWRSVIADGDYDELVLWYEHDLFCQLNLIQLLTWIQQHGRVTRPVGLVCIGSFPGRPNFMGLGELTPQELAPLLETRQPVTSMQYDVAARAWDAYRAPTPEALGQLLRTDTSALPFLASAIRRFLEEYPWTTNGLTKFERRLLELTADGPVTLMTLFPRMQQGESAYYMTDSSLVELADALARPPNPLLTVSVPPSTDVVRALERTVTLTDAGRDVLAGRADRIALRGIDKWLGGVHLATGNDSWRWDPAREMVVGR